MERTHRLVSTIAIAVILCLPGIAAAQQGRYAEGRRGGGLTGTVLSINQRLNYFTIRDEATGRDVKIDVRQMGTDQSVNVWRLRAGDRVVVDGGWKSRDTFQADRVVADQGRGGYGDAKAVRGVARSFNRRLNYFTVRDQAGRDVKVDVRRMDSRGSIDVWQLRPGDRVVIDGSWESRDTFAAERVSVPGRIRRDRGQGASVLNGIVQSTNRRLNYVTVRDQATGRSVKIDVRQMDTARSFNVWQLRVGDRVAVDGEWKSDDSFQANTVNYQVGRP